MSAAADDRTFEERVAALEAYVPMLDRLGGWESYHEKSIPAQVNWLQEVLIGAAEYLSLRLMPLGTMWESWNGPYAVAPAFGSTAPGDYPSGARAVAERAFEEDAGIVPNAGRERRRVAQAAVEQLRDIGDPESLRLARQLDEASDPCTEAAS